MTSTVMTGNAIREALEPISKIAEFFADEQEWRDHDTIMVAPMENLREAQHLTVGDLRRARTAYDATGSGVKALEWSEAGGATALGLSYDVWLTKDAAQGYREIWLAALMQGGRESIGTFSSKEKAQAACQADFERRVLSCLSPVAVEEADAKAERKGHTPSDEEMDEATIRQRDIAEDAADKLAEAIGELLGVNVGEHSSAHSPWETALEHAGQAVRNRALSTDTAAGAGPVGESVAPLDETSLRARIGEIGNQVHNVACEHQNVEDLAGPLSAIRDDLWKLAQQASARPVEVERLTRENNRLTDAAMDAEAALTETRERLEKERNEAEASENRATQECLIANGILNRCYLAMRDAMKLIDPNKGPGHKHSDALTALAQARVEIELHNAARAALTGDAQEGGK